ncbi:hypothetical protein NE237_032193 [Protea cynaroides]|uniref:Uncharacterized protein n=1 Tax=Protea cynaroides TaxID=273540 RepID=A0A9Q0L324_9MAGN|nr:hypothetical protein NE237_032193 [Protea cynaroides]
MVFQGFSKVADGRRVQDESCGARGDPGKGLRESSATTVPTLSTRMLTGGSCFSAARLSSGSRRLQIVSMIARGIGQKGLVLHLQIPIISLADGVEDRCTGSRDLSIVVGHRNDKEVAKVVTNQISMPGEPTVVGEGDDTTAMGVYGWLGPGGQFDHLEQQRFVFIKSRNLAPRRSVQAPISGVLPTVREARSKAEGSSREGVESRSETGIFVDDDFCGCDYGYCSGLQKDRGFDGLRSKFSITLIVVLLDLTHDWVLIEGAVS